MVYILVEANLRVFCVFVCLFLFALPLEIQLLIKDGWVPIIPFDGYVRVVQLYIENNANKTNIFCFFREGYRAFVILPYLDLSVQSTFKVKLGVLDTSFIISQGRIQDFILGGAHLKNLRERREARKCLGYFV